MRRADPTGLRRFLPFVFAGLFLLLARDDIAALDWSDVLGAAAGISPTHWALATLATAVSFAALGRYDQLVHGALGTGVDARRTRWSGMAAIALGQMAGAGLLTGALIRWRLMPDLSLGVAGRITLIVTASFLAAWAVLTSFAVLLFLPVGDGASALALAILAASSLLALLAFVLPRLSVAGRHLTLPPLALMARILGLTATDTLAAATVLYLLLPQDALPGFTAFLPAFLLALGAGMVSGTPGGIGPFELMLATLCPDLPAEGFAASLLCYRLVYFAAPALIAGVIVAWSVPGAKQCQAAPPLPTAALGNAVRAETGLWRQGMHGLFTLPMAPGTAWLTARAGQAQVALFDPADGDRSLQRLLPAFRAAAGAAGLIPALYKIGPRSAALARRAGWCVHPLAEEFWLRPADFTTDGPARATLRRKIRQADRAGLRIEGFAPGQMQAPLWAAMKRVNHDWAARHGGERGFSMGRYDTGYLCGQRLYLAWSGTALAGFVSFHPGRREWTLDLMRPAAAAPDGTMQALIIAALADARALGIARLSLAAAPLPRLGLGDTVWTARLGALTERLTPPLATNGLRRFKSGFAPNRTRLYLAAPSRPALIWAGAEIARAVRWPGPLPSPGDSNSNIVQDDPEKLAFDVF